MSRPLRIEFKDAWYHVMNRGRRSEKIFLDDKDFRSFIQVVEEAVDLWKVNVCAFCLMPNHYHLLIQTPEANISRCMRHINGVYTQRFNRRHEIDGQLFRGRFKSILIGENSYLLELVRYICFNPVKAGLVKKPGQYQWSSYNDYLSQQKVHEWLHRDLILTRLNPGKRGKKLNAGPLKLDASEDTYEFFNKKSLPTIFGSDSYVEEIRNNFFHKLVHPEKPESKDLQLKSQEIIEEICQAFGVNKKTLLKPQRGKSNTPRDMAIYFMRYKTGLKLTEIGKIFQIDSYSTVSSCIERMKKEIATKEVTGKLFKKIEGKLIR